MKAAAAVGAGAAGRHRHGTVREAERRLSAILRTARKLSVSPADVAGLVAARKLREAARGGGGGGRALLPVAAAVGALVVLLLVCSAEPQSASRLKNTSETCVPSASDVASPSPQTPTADPVLGRPQRDDPPEQQLQQRRQR